MIKKKNFSLKVNGKDQPQPTTNILAAIVASPFAAETAAVIESVMANEKFLVALEKAESVEYEDESKRIITTGSDIVGVLPHLHTYHKQAAELAKERERLNGFRSVEWKKQRGRQRKDSGKVSDISLDL